MESARVFRERLNGHLWAAPPSMTMVTPLGITVVWILFAIVGREAHNITRTIKEAM